MNVCLLAWTTLLVVCLAGACLAQTDWAVVVARAGLEDEAIKVCLTDLTETARAHGLTLTTATDETRPATNAIVVGDATRKRVTSDLRRRGIIALAGVQSAQGYEIVTAADGETTTVVVAGGSVLGDVYGLYWLWDRIRVLKRVPTLKVKHQPDLETRYTRTQVKSKRT